MAKFYDFETKERAAGKEIAELAKQYPSLKPRFAQIAHEQIAQKYHRVQDILMLMKQEVRLMKREVILTRLRQVKTPPQSK